MSFKKLKIFKNKQVQLQKCEFVSLLFLQSSKWESNCQINQYLNIVWITSLDFAISFYPTHIWPTNITTNVKDVCCCDIDFLLDCPALLACQNQWITKTKQIPHLAQAWGMDWTNSSKLHQCVPEALPSQQNYFSFRPHDPRRWNRLFSSRRQSAHTE